MLRKEGYSVTQATLSRDLKMLKVGKIPTAGQGTTMRSPKTI
jgi:transcriptional regulator of arginine metabolism